MDIVKSGALGRSEREEIEQFCHGRAQVTYLGNRRALCRVLGKYLVYVDTQDLSVAPHLMLDGCWEMWITMAVAKYVKPGMQCVDVGANWGYYTLLLADLAGAGNVQAWEPQTRVRLELERTLAVNGMRADGVEVIAEAAGAADHVAWLTMPAEAWGDASVTSKGPERVNDGQSITVHRIDSVRQTGTSEFDLVDFAKIDAEGSEPAVWEGLVATLAPKAVVLLEFTPKRYEDAFGFLGNIHAAGFRLNRVRDDGAIETTTESVVLSSKLEMLWLSR